MMRKKVFTLFLPDVLVVVICLTSVGLSVVESRLNSDDHHWGLMYANADDLVAGLLPYKEIFIQYGFLTTLLHGLCLYLFGNNVVSIGVGTGISYALNLWLSFLLWQRFLGKWPSALATGLMFLVQAYIIFPWANCFAYTFLLGALLCLTAPTGRPRWHLAAGILLGLSYLARQSLMPILAPFYLWYAYNLIVSPAESRPRRGLEFVLFHAGALAVMGVFFLFLLCTGAWRDWVAQSFTITSFYLDYFGGTKKILLKFMRNLLLGRGFAGRDIRLILYSVVFFNAAVLWCLILWRMVKRQAAKKDSLLFLVVSVVLFGYIQAMHIYDVFRLQSASSLGLGLLILSAGTLTARSRPGWKIAVAVPALGLVLYLALTLLFTRTSAVYSPWPQTLLVDSTLAQPQGVPMLRGKLYDAQTRAHYEAIARTLHRYEGRLEYLITFAVDGFARQMSPAYKKLQRSPFYSAGLTDLIFQDEPLQIARLLSEEKALLIANDLGQIPGNYRPVLDLSVPGSVRLWKRSFYVAVPRSLKP